MNGCKALAGRAESFMILDFLGAFCWQLATGRFLSVAIFQNLPSDPNSGMALKIKKVEFRLNSEYLF